MKNDNKDLSIIVPVYNTQNYVKECLSSILKIKRIDIEVIVVDDASPDRSMEIVKKEFSNDERLKIIRLKENKGLSVARNEGIKKAVCKYILFMDSDDIIEPCMVENIYSYIIEKQPDVLACTKRITFDDGTSPDKIVPPEKNLDYQITSGIDFYIKAFKEGNIIVMAPSYFYRKDFLLNHALFFIANLLHEDEEFYPRWCEKAKTVLPLPVSFFYYRQNRKGSITSENFRKRLPHLKQVIEHLYTLSQRTINKKFAYYLKFYVSNLTFYSVYSSRVHDKDIRKWGKKYLTVNSSSLKFLFSSFLKKYFPLCFLRIKMIMNNNGRKTKHNR